MLPGSDMRQEGEPWPPSRGRTHLAPNCRSVGSVEARCEELRAKAAAEQEVLSLMVPPQWKSTWSASLTALTNGASTAEQKSSSGLGTPVSGLGTTAAATLAPPLQQHDARRGRAHSAIDMRARESTAPIRPQSETDARDPPQQQLRSLRPQSANDLRARDLTPPPQQQVRPLRALSAAAGATRDLTPPPQQQISQPRPQSATRGLTVTEHLRLQCPTGASDRDVGTLPLQHARPSRRQSQAEARARGQRVRRAEPATQQQQQHPRPLRGRSHSLS